MKIKLTPTAISDIRNISRYTFEKWGENKRVEYIHEIDFSINQIAQNISLGKSRDDLKKDVRSKNVGKHVIFYRAKEEYVEILTIMHQSMDIETRLPQFND